MWTTRRQKPIILHADLDCFYCQVEHKRLGVPTDVPLCVQQWSKVIAVNYAARARGVTRLASVGDSIQRCPGLRLVHVSTLSAEPSRLGAAQFYGAYSAEGDPAGQPPVPDNRTHKASLDVYRKASAQIFQLMRRFSDVFERASVDEAFIDVTKAVGVRLKRLAGDATPEAVRTVWTGLDWSLAGRPAADGLAESGLALEDMVDEVRIWIGSRIAAEMREEIRSRLGFTASVGIAHNKTLAKLASAQHKPDQQTFVLSRLLPSWLRLVPLSKIRFLGGNLGGNLGHNLGHTNSDSSDADTGHPLMAADLWDKSIDDLERVVGCAEAARRVYQVVRGIDDSPVTPRLETKTLLSAKKLSPPLREWSDVQRWLTVLAAELGSRLEEDLCLYSRWPQSLTVSYRSGKSKAVGFPFAPIDRFRSDVLAAYATKVLVHEHAISPLFPCSHLSLGLSRFVRCPSKSMRSTTLDSFLSLGKDNDNDKDNGKDKDKDLWTCPKCSKALSPFDCDGIREHEDHHFALSLVEH